MALTDIIKPKVSELGRIKIGRKGATRTGQSGREWQLPEKLDHFLLTGMDRDDKGNFRLDAELMEALKAEGYGDKDGHLRRLPVRVLSNDPEDIMQASYLWYAGRVCGARSDGVSVTWLNDPHNGKALPQPLVEPWNPEFLNLTNSKGDKLFKQHVTLRVVIASKHARWGGFYVFRTTGEISAGQLLGNLYTIKNLTAGILLGMPLTLVVRPMQVTPLIKGERKSTTVYVVHLELIGEDLQKLQHQAMEQARFMVSHKTEMDKTLGEYRKLLAPPGRDESPQEQADINEEFQPETADEGEAQRVTPSEHDPFFDESHETPVTRGLSDEQLAAVQQALAVFSMEPRILLEHFHVERLEDIPEDQYSTAVDVVAAKGEAAVSSPEFPFSE